MTWTPPFYGVQHLEGVPRRWQITLNNLGKGGTRVYMLDNRSKSAFTPVREAHFWSPEQAESLAEAKRLGEGWLAELLAKEAA